MKCIFLLAKQSRGHLIDALFSACLIFFPALVFAGAPLAQADTARVVDTLAERMHQHYVSAEVGRQVAAGLRLHLARRSYDGLDTEQLAEKLTIDLVALTHDEHAGVLYMDKTLDPVDTPISHAVSNMTRAGVDAWNQRVSSARVREFANHFGLPKSERLAGNVAYLRIDSFGEIETCGPSIEAELQATRDAAALIIDLRENGGGRIESATLAASYLFDDQPVHLLDEIMRGTGRVRPIWTSPIASDLRIGKKKPVYLLVSHDTFSAGESFAYVLQAAKRAVVIGVPTRGGAHGARGYVIHPHLLASVPSRRMTSPVTHGDWEGTGVQPDLSAAPDQSLAIALAMAAKSAVVVP
ncbi:S41 family peptidase [Massilia sp. S19_KUP03_FR1]|uniref:S41 family peptidase n=1 Tax=Massilia sp. S19_KUP03_FR1 TaxID=3025503 RepID=UPI002FCCC73D